MAPDKNTGAYSRHFDKVIGCTPSDSQFYDLPLGRRMRHSSFRTFEPIAVQPLHEALASEFALHSEELVGDLAAAREASRLPKIYLDHPWVKESGDAVIHPYVLYVDGVSFSRTDTVLGIYSYFSGRVESTCLLAVVRKSEFCRCGCGSWCTLQPLFLSLAWSMEALGRGTWPSSRHDNTRWWAIRDDRRASRSGTPFGFRAVCIFLKADWMEFINTLGLMSFQTQNSPCPFCLTDLTRFFELLGYSAVSMPFPWKDLTYYNAACAACERTVVISSVAMRTKIAGVLEYDKRKKGGNKGRTLSADIEELHLVVGDRLEPGPLLADVASFEDGIPPFSVTFWRVSEETCTHHRNPIFAQRTGFGLCNLGVDWLHCLSKGVFQVFLAHLL